MTNAHSHTCAGKATPGVKLPQPTVILLLSAICLALANTPASAFDARGGQFIGFKSFSAFEKSPGARPGEIVLTSPELVACLNWNELIASWNAETPDTPRRRAIRSANTPAPSCTKAKRYRGHAPGSKSFGGGKAPVPGRLCCPYQTQNMSDTTFGTTKQKGLRRKGRNPCKNGAPVRT